MLLLLPAVINDPESSGFDTGAASGVEISHPDLLTTFQLLLLIVCFLAMGHASDQIKTADRRIKVIACGVFGMFVGSVPIFSLMRAEPSTAMAFFMQVRATTPLLSVFSHQPFSTNERH